MARQRSIFFDAKHIKYLQSKPGKTIDSLYKLDMSEIRIPQNSLKNEIKLEKKMRLDNHFSVSDYESAEVC